MAVAVAGGSNVRTRVIANRSSSSPRGRFQENHRHRSSRLLIARNSQKQPPRNKSPLRLAAAGERTRKQIEIPEMPGPGQSRRRASEGYLGGFRGGRRAAVRLAVGSFYNPRTYIVFIYIYFVVETAKRQFKYAKENVARRSLSPGLAAWQTTIAGRRSVPEQQFE